MSFLILFLMRFWSLDESTISLHWFIDIIRVLIFAHFFSIHSLASFGHIFYKIKPITRNRISIKCFLSQYDVNREYNQLKRGMLKGIKYESYIHNTVQSRQIKNWPIFLVSIIYFSEQKICNLIFSVVFENSSTTKFSLVNGSNFRYLLFLIRRLRVRPLGGELAK